jgi:hypothetical protein
MRILPFKWLFVLFFSTAPVLVAIMETLQLEFPEIDPLLGQPYNPWSPIISSSVICGLVIGAISNPTVFVSTQRYFRSWAMATQVQLATIGFLTLLAIIALWIGIIWTQQMVIVEWLIATNANGLYFFRPFSIEPFPSSTSYVLANIIGLIWTISIIIYVVFHSRDKLDFPGDLC